MSDIKSEQSTLVSSQSESLEKSYLSKNGGQTLRRSLGCTQLFAYVVGILIGSGIYISPGLVAKYSSNMAMALMIWAASGIICLFGSLCFCELAVTLKKTGGHYIFIKETYGDLAGFCMVWATILVICPAGLAVVAVAIGEHVVGSFANISTPNGVWMVKIISVVCIFVSFLINIVSTSFTSKTQAFFAVIQILGIMFFVCIGIWKVSTGSINNYVVMFAVNDTHEGSASFAGVSVAFYSALWSYDGWGVISTVTEELHNGEKDLWLALVTGIPFVIACYILINLAFMSVLSHTEMASSPVVATTFVAKCFGPKVALIVPILVALSCFGCLNATMFFLSRSMLSAAREGHLPEPLAYIHSGRRTPIPALLVLFLLGSIWVLALGSGTIILITYFSVAVWITYGAALFATIVLRIRRPNLPRPFKVWIVNPIFMTFVSLYLIIAPFFKTPIECCICLGTLLLSIPVYYLFIYNISSISSVFCRFKERIYKFILCYFNLTVCVYEEIRAEPPVIIQNTYV